jgi:hypothetical protein
MNAPNQNFQMTLTRAGDGMHLLVRDVTSTKVVMEADLSPEAFLDFMSARETGKGVPVWFLPEPARLNIGRYPATVSRVLSREEHSNVSQEFIDNWIEQMRRWLLLAEIAEKPRIRGGGRGELLVVFRSYFDTEEQASAWRESTQKLLDTASSPAELERKQS